jgi:hypothetical protein
MTEKQAIRRLRDDPRGIVLWLDLFFLSAPRMPEALRDQIRSHDLTRTGVILGFKDQLEGLMGADLEVAHKRLEAESAALVCADVVAEMIRLKTIAQCRDAHAEGNYYRDAEPYMQKQWDAVIWPIIQNLDFQHVLELAPGHGR